MANRIVSGNRATDTFRTRAILARAALAGATLLLACGSVPPHEKTAVTSAAITQSGSGRFQGPLGRCIVPSGPVAVGTGIQLGTCTAALSNKFTLGPSVGIGDDLVAQTRAATVRTGEQGTLMMGNLCLEGNPSTGVVQLNACRGTCQTEEDSAGDVFPANCPSFPGGIGRTSGSANGWQEWKWNQGRLESAYFPQMCLTVPNIDASIATLTLASCSPEAFQSFLPLDFNLVFASGIQASFLDNVPNLPVSPLTVPANFKQNFQCFDHFLNGFLGANTLDDFECNGTDAQWFHFDDLGLLRTLANSCVGAPGGVGQPILTEACTGAAEQQWAYSGTTLSSLIGTGTASQSCIDVAGEKSSPLTALQLSSCPAAATHLAGQMWMPNLIWPKVQSIQYKNFPNGAGWIQGGSAINGDFDHNGFTDVAYVFKSDGVPGTVTNGTIDIDVYLNDGKSFTLQRWSTELGGWIDGMTFYGGDFNGDGFDDIAAVFNDGSNQFNIDVHRSTGRGFAAPERWAGASTGGGVVNPGLWLSGDFDGDGRSDLAYIFSLDTKNIDIDAHLSTGSMANGGFAAPAHWAMNQGGWIDVNLHDPSSNFIVGGEDANQECEACIRAGQWVAGDFNGDGRTDLALTFADTSNHIDIDTHLSTGSAFTGTRAATNAGGWVDTSWWVAEDMNNDGRADMVEFYDTFVSGTPPNLNVYTSSIDGLTVPGGQNAFVGAIWGGVGNDFQDRLGALNPIPPTAYETFYRLPLQACSLCIAHRWFPMGNIMAGGFAHQIGSGFGDVMFVEPAFEALDDRGASGGPTTIELSLAF